MKKVCNILIIVIISIAFLPLSTSATTLGEYEKKLENYKKQQQENNAAINRTQNEINSANGQINNLKSEMISIVDEVKKLNEEVETYNKQIQDKLNESKQVIEYLQLSSGENAYLNYIFKAEDAAELIYRRSVIKELVDYNNKAINDMQKIIDANKVREEEIEKRKVTINEKEEELNKRVVSLGESKERLNTGALSVKEEIENIQKIIDAYKKLGCKSTDVIGIDCAVSGGAGIFRRPTEQGYVTQEAYYTVYKDSAGKVTGSYTHRGLDIGSYRGRGEKIYPIGNGTITSIYTDGWGAKCIVIVYYDAVNRVWYSTIYAHLSSYAPGLKVGQNVTSDQYVGYMGDTGKASGIHLHMEVFPCRFLIDNQCGTWDTYFSYATNMLKNGYKGARGIINFPSGLYNTWRSR